MKCFVLRHLFIWTRLTTIGLLLIWSSLGVRGKLLGFIPHVFNRNVFLKLRVWTALLICTFERCVCLCLCVCVCVCKGGLFMILWIIIYFTVTVWKTPSLYVGLPISCFFVKFFWECQAKKKLDYWFSVVGFCLCLLSVHWLIVLTFILFC